MNIRYFIFEVIYVVILSLVCIYTTLIAQYMGASYMISLAVAVFVIILSFKPFEKYLAHITDKLLFQKKYNHFEELEQIQLGIKKCAEIDDLKHYITSAVADKFRLEKVKILEKRELQNEASICKQFGIAMSLEIFSNGELFWILMLGRKKSGRPYTQDDRHIFSALADVISLSLSSIIIRNKVEHIRIMGRFENTFAQ